MSVSFPRHKNTLLVCRMGRVQLKYCNDCMRAPAFGCLPVFQFHSYNQSQKPHVRTSSNFSVGLYFLWTWFGSFLAAMRYVMHFRFRGWRHFSQNSPHGTSLCITNRWEDNVIAETMALIPTDFFCSTIKIQLSTHSISSSSSSSQIFFKVA